MIIDISYWTRVLTRILYVVFILLGLIIALKLSIFYLPFLIAFIIYLIMEPAIKWIMKKTKATRKMSSIIIFFIVSLVILGALTWLIFTLFSEASNLLQDLNKYIEKAYSLFQNILQHADFGKIRLPDEIQTILQNSTGDILETVSQWVRAFLNGLIDVVTSIPNIAIYFSITVIALYFICVDKIYILDQIEHHLPKTWVMRVGKHIKDLTKTLGGYLKAEATLILVSFIISLIGLYILKFTGFAVEFPLLIICGINGDLNLGIAIIVLLIIMSIVRQFLEPRLVSKNIGVHPLFTLIAMYTGFRFMGIIGMLVGPIVLIILKNIFATLIDGGVMKTIFDKR